MVVNGRALKLIMHDRHITCKTLSELIGVSYFSISGWRNGKNQISKRHLAIVSKVLNVAPATLVTESERVDIIRCKDCVYYKDKTCYSTLIPHPQPDEFYFCGDAAKGEHNA